MIQTFISAKDDNEQIVVGEASRLLLEHCASSPSIVYSAVLKAVHLLKKDFESRSTYIPRWSGIYQDFISNPDLALSALEDEKPETAFRLGASEIVKLFLLDNAHDAAILLDHLCDEIRFRVVTAELLVRSSPTL